MLRVSLFAAATLAVAAAAPTQCNVSSYGTGCGGVSAVGSAVPNGNTVRVSFSIRNATPGESVLFLVGGPAANIRIFDSNCFLLLEPVFAQVHQIGHDGTYTFSKALPSTFEGRARVQFGEARVENGALLLKMTNGLELDCRPD